MRDKLGCDLMRAASRFAIIVMLGGLTAACTSDRFAAGGLSNPFSSGPSEPTRTGSVNSEPGSAPMPRSSIETQPLAPIRPVPGAAPAAPPAYSAPPAHSTAPVPSRPRTAAGGAGWSTAGGTTVIVGPGETLSTLTSRYGVPAEAILSSNNLTAPDVKAGRRVVIPVYSATGEGGAPPQRRAEAAPAAAPRYNAPAAPAPRVVATHKIETQKQPPRTVAEAAPPKSQLRPGQAKAPEPARPAARIVEAKRPVETLPKVAAKAEPQKVAKAAPAKEIILPAKKVAAKAEPVKPAAKADTPQKVAKVEPARSAPKPVEAAKAPVREPEVTASIAPAAPVAPASSGSSADFRWPARGRVITGFGGGGGNEGINIAVPEGTPVKAAGDGVVAYAGSEVKGYGNLVLIRHDNGYVSAYANNGQLDVKRGQRVNRGQAIAKSGQTGNVTSPQLHFEIRKGSTPVDPMKYLASAE